MASQGPNSPSSGANDAGVGTADWLNPGAVTVSNDAYASGSGDVTSHYLVATGFGFAVPAGATVNGIVVEWEKVAAGGTGADVAARIVKGGAVGATDRSVGGAWPTSDAYVSHGGAADLWGETWTPAEVNAADFGAALAATGVDTDSPLVDHCRVTVYYTPAASSHPPPARTFRRPDAPTDPQFAE